MKTPAIIVEQGFAEIVPFRYIILFTQKPAITILIVIGCEKSISDKGKDRVCLW